jgi:hypothetical protein
MKIQIPYVLVAAILIMAGMFADRLASAQTPSPAVTLHTTFVPVGVGEIPVRTAAEQTVTDTTKRYGFEVYEDSVNGNLIYITETGSIAVVHATKPAPDNTAPPATK